MGFKTLDLFSLQFSFNMRESQTKKGTLTGSFISLIILVLTFSYLCYLMSQYINNQVEPSYRAQNYSNNQSIDLELTPDLIAFRFEWDYSLSINVLQQQKNKTYIIYKAYYALMTPNNQTYIKINVTSCKDDPILEGFYCLDFSNLPNQMLVSDRVDRRQSQIQIFSYGCLDQDLIKKDVPDDCATQSEIDDILNAPNSGIKFLLKTSQFNIRTQKIEQSYQQSLIYTMTSQSSLTSVKIQNQQTNIKKGLFIQSESNFTSVLQYGLENQSLDMQNTIKLTNISSFSQINFMVDNIYQKIQIQYQTIPQILSQVNSTFQMMMLIGIIIRQFSLRSIKNQLFMVLLQNSYQQSYMQILKKNNLVKEEEKELSNIKNQNSQIDNQSQGEVQEQNDYQEEKSISFIPQLNFKMKQDLDQQSYISKMLTPNQDFQQRLSKYLELYKNQQVKNNILLDDQPKEEQQTQEINKSLTLQHSSNFKQQFDKSVNNNQSLLIDQNNIFQTQQLQLLSNNSFYSPKMIKKQFSNFQKKTKIQNQNNFCLIEKTNGFIKNLNILKDKKLFMKASQSLFRCQIRKLCIKKEENEQQILNKFQTNQIYERIEKDLNISQFYSDILFLKKAVLMLLSSEQFAALQMIGFSSNYLSMNKSEIEEYFDQSQKDDGKSHFEELMAISQSNILQEKNIYNFIQRCQNNANLTSIDQRIMSSINNYVKF